MTPLAAALLAQLSYIDAPTIGKSSGAARMHAYSTADGIVHAFRGTDDLRSIIADVECQTVDVWGLGELHAGFYGALATILSGCLALPRPAAIVGHSLGAAMAIIYAGILAQLGIVVPVYAFEPPRLCGDSVLADLFKAVSLPLYATRNADDIVTQVPVNLALPGTLTRIGRAQYPFDNIADHGIDDVVRSLQVT